MTEGRTKYAVEELNMVASGDSFAIVFFQYD